MKNYEINLKTMAIIPISKNFTQIIEEDNEFYVDKSPFEIIKHSCKYFGSTYEGRHIGTMAILGISYKTPILVEETNNIIFFPTTSSKSNSCSWISLNNISSYQKNNKKSKIIFKNGVEIDLNISIGVLENQILRSTMLESVIRKRRNK